MEFVETTYFTKKAAELLSEDEYALFQGYMYSNPKAGDVIQGTGGARKVRWNAKGSGKSGGVRVIYYYAVSASQIRCLLIYKKGVQDDLTPAQKKQLKDILNNW